MAKAPKTQLDPGQELMAMPGVVKASDVIVASPEKGDYSHLPKTDQRSEVVEELFLTPEEIEAIKALRERRALANSASEQRDSKFAVNELAEALIRAIESTRPPQKAKAYQRKKICKACGREHKTNTLLTRTWSQHGGIELRPEQYCNSTIELLNKVRPGVYVKGLVRVTKRRDRSYDISWPVRTSAQRLRVMNEAGVTFDGILQRCIDEHSDPKRFRGPDDNDDD